MTTVTKTTETDTTRTKTALTTGFHDVAADTEFARRSAKYLATHGYRQVQIRAALVEQLDLTPSRADDIVSTLAA